MFKKIKSRGFTIVELLVVIAIIGLLASIIFVATRGASTRAKYAKVFSFASTINHAIGAEMVGEWKFDEANGTTVNDTSGNGYNLTAQNNVREVNGGIPELKNCMVFNSTPTMNANAIVTVPSASSLNLGGGSITMSFWVKNNNTLFVARHYISNFVSLAPSSSYHYAINRNIDNTIYLNIGISSYPSTGSLTSGAGDWYFIVATFKSTGINSGEYAIYINDQKDSGGPITPIWAKAGVASTFYVGGSRFLSNYYPSESTIDDVRVYADALTTSQIHQLYAEGATKHGIAISK
jgi:prepilin-type N-terminal cleavage/methylation domain-containing protein